VAPGQSDSEALAALGPAAADDVPAAPGAHADQKAVGAFPSNVMGLESSFHKVNLKGVPLIQEISQPTSVGSLN
jgi:hypothetical protein